jgi:hypothetical protein
LNSFYNPNKLPNPSNFWAQKGNSTNDSKKAFGSDNKNATKSFGQAPGDGSIFKF